jgi:Ser/Thr protein kinase RdoA (MazF antagonist)
MFEGARVLDHVDPPISESEAERLATAFGVGGRAERLGGERDQNFRLLAEDGEAYLLKVSNSAEAPDVTDFQTRALLHMAAADPALPVPRIRCATTGDPHFVWDRDDGAPRLVRLLTFLPGTPLHQAKADVEILRVLGQTLARLDLALGGFTHPAAHHELLWDLQHADRLRDFLANVQDVQHRELAEFGLEQFRTKAARKLPARRSQVIHNDLNPHNVLVASLPNRVTGLLDLGDAVWAPLVDEVAVAAAYHLDDGPEPLAPAVALVRGYHSRLPLQEDEVELICPLIATRLAMTVIITSWRAAKYPDNRDYIVRNRPAALRGLARLRELGEQATEQMLGALQEVGSEHD